VEATQPDPLVGSIVGERYRILAPLGRGGMGAVYRVEHLMMKKELALKLLHPELGRLDEVTRRFEREAEAAARLSHANIISVTDFGRTPDGMLFLVMELLHGPSLTDVIRPDGENGRPLPRARALHILTEILSALEHAHASGIVHRDLKPDNIVLVEREGDKDFVKLLDFGIAKITDESAQSLTQAGVVFGTPEYLSPEQAMGEEADGRADLYAAGVILYEMLTGNRPFRGSSRVEVISMHLTRPIPPLPAELRELEPLVQKAMAKKRDERFPSAAAFAEALAHPPSAVHRTVDHLRARLDRGVDSLVWRAREAGVPWPRAFVGAGFLLALSLLVLVVGFWRPHRPSAELQKRLDEAEGLMAHNQLAEAKSELREIAAADPKIGRTHYLLGNLEVREGDRDDALEEYKQAVELDDRFRANPILRANVSAMLDRRGEGASALSLLVDTIGKPALPEVVACAKLCKDEKVRRRAAEAAVQLGGPALLAAEGKAADDDDDTLEKLRNGKTCRDRKAAALKLIALDDKRHLDSLRAARDRRGGFLGLQEINGCMRRELDAAVRKLESK
jgi:tRNA A-37 threonylcarbamoyl transferase component Bud32/tetratricopeptide (TPR) repeat protein